MTREEQYYLEYQQMITYLKSEEYYRKTRMEFEKRVAQFNLSFGTNYTPEDFQRTGGIYVNA